MHQQVIQITSLTPEQFQQVLRGAVRAELAELAIGQPVATQLPELLNRAETAKLLRVSLVTLHKLSNKGVIQKRSIDGQIRYRRQDVLDAMQAEKNQRTKR